MPHRLTPEGDPVHVFDPKTGDWTHVDTKDDKRPRLGGSGLATRRLQVRPQFDMPIADVRIRPIGEVDR